MSIYRCNQCKGRFDRDFDVCELDPRDPDELELLCPNCYADVYEAGNDGLIQWMIDSENHYQSTLRGDK